jgi:uncharacterized membrane protein YdjX (TVP38/TMEM64 family)
LCIAVFLHFYPLQDLILQIQRLGVFSIIAFVAAYIVRGFLYFPTLYFLVASGIVFPPYLGICVYLSGILLSATLSYWIGTYLHDTNRFPKFKKKIQEPEIKARICERGINGVFFFHITGISLDIPNYLSGYVGLAYRNFLATVLAANLITATSYYLIFVF